VAGDHPVVRLGPAQQRLSTAYCKPREAQAAASPQIWAGESRRWRRRPAGGL